MSEYVENSGINKINYYFNSIHIINEAPARISAESSRGAVDAVMDGRAPAQGAHARALDTALRGRTRDYVPNAVPRQ
jgi:hypothetical protein